jgi:anti-sigma factor RsiW
MTCRDIIEFLADFLDGGLPSEERAVFEAHLAQCPACVVYLRTYEQTIRLGKAISTHPPEEPPEELIQAILAARPAGPGVSRQGPRPPGA